jgi:asparagine synthase (glutamine-hydrolysing)
MCGIVGILHTDGQGVVNETVLTKMISILRYRGPDETGIYVDEQIGLGHARLSIIGLAGGGQPICNEDGTLWIIYNGEAFNYIELKEDLVKKGHLFSTATDTEVLLHLYEELGPRCLEQINGQFALAIWDARKKELFLARDRVGIRPLFFTKIRNKLLFASEIKALFLDPDVSREIDPHALYQTLTFWTTLSPKTIFKNVYELPPGHYMLIKDGQMSQTPFWTIPFYAQDELWHGSVEEAEEALKALLIDAVRLRLRADVPVGAYLSGGLDSSLTTAIIAKRFNNRLRSFSMSFEEDRFDETPFQQQMSQYLGTQHSQVTISNPQIRDCLPEVIWHCEIPLVRTGPVPLFLLSRLVREHHFKVVLTGEGADEVLGGYDIFKEAKVRQFWGRQPESNVRPLLLKKLYPDVFVNDRGRGTEFLRRFFAPGDLTDQLFSHSIRWKNSGKNTTFLSEPFLAAVREYRPLDEMRASLPANFDGRDMLAKAQVLEMQIFLSNYLLSSQGDRVAMAHSLEIRVPFLDYRVIDFAFKLPSRWKIRGLTEKYLLKRAAREFLPETIRQRVKKPYRAPMHEAFFGHSGGEYVKELLTEESLDQAGYFDSQKVRFLLAKYEKSGDASEVQDMALVGILTTQLLHQQFIDHFPRDIVPCEPTKVIHKKVKGTQL